MATFTSVQNGDWNDGATWGNTSPGTKGTDWPGNSGDVFNAGHSICYNVSETNPLSASQVQSRGNLYFSASANTKLTFGHVYLTVGNSCRLTVGQSGSPIPCSYTAEIYWNTTADNNRGLNSPSGGTGGISFCGDPAYYGSLFTSWLVNTWQGGQTFVVSGDMYNRWLAGQTVIIHQFQDSYNDWDTDTHEFTISSIWNNGGNTSILIAEAAPGSSTIFNAGGPAINPSRNVILGKLNFGTGVYSLNSNRPEVDVAEVSSDAVFVAHDMIFGGFHHIECDFGNRFKNVVIRNGYYGLYHMIYSVFDDVLLYSLNAAQYISDCNELTNPYFVVNNYGVVDSDVNIITSMTMFSCNQGMRDCYNNEVSGLAFDNSAVLRGCHNHKTYIRGWANNDLYYGCCDCTLENGYIGYDLQNNYKPNNYDFHMVNYNKNYVKCTVVNSPMSFLYRNEYNMGGGTYFANFDEIPNNLYIAHEFYDLTRSTTIIRSGGNGYSIKVSPFSKIIDRKNYIIEDWYEYDLEAGIEQTRIVYIMGVGWSTFPTSGKLCLEAYYYDASSGCHCGMSVSTATLTQNSVWTPFTVTFTPIQSYTANYKIYLQAYESTSAHIYIDNQIRNEL